MLPASSAGTACTSAVIEVSADASDEQYRAKVEFWNQEELRVLLERVRIWLPVEGWSKHTLKCQGKTPRNLLTLFWRVTSMQSHGSRVQCCLYNARAVKTNGKLLLLNYCAAVKLCRNPCKKQQQQGLQKKTILKLQSTNAP